MSRWKSGTQGTRDAATLLPVAAAALLLPPFILVFAAPVLVAGIPLIVVYVFAVWAAIILGAWLLSRCHAQPPEGEGISSQAESEQAEAAEPGAR
jgi:hypothetical protein